MPTIMAQAEVIELVSVKRLRKQAGSIFGDASPRRRSI